MNKELQDPTRIPKVLDAVRSVWEGQPDLNFGAICEILAHHGVSWSTPDSKVEEICRRLAAANPPRLPLDQGRCVGVHVVQTTEANYTVDGEWVIRHASGQAVAWRYQEVAHSNVGEPLLIIDTEGIRHRLGLVLGIARLEEPSLWLCLGEGDRALVGQGRVKLWRPGRRETSYEQFSYRECPSLVEGEELSFVDASGKKIALDFVPCTVLPVE